MHSESAAPAATSAPVDRFWFAWCLFVLLGVGSLFPWNAFITAGAYFEQRFCGTDTVNVFENVFSVTNSGSQLIGLGAALKYSHLVPLRQRILFPLLLYCGIFVITAGLVFASDISSDAILSITVLSIFITALCGALYTGGVFGLAACFPPDYTQGAMVGQGVAGLVVAFAAIVSIAAAEDDTECNDDDDDCDDFSVDYSAFAYFFVSIVVMLICIGGYYVLEALPITRYYALQAIADPEQRDRTETASKAVRTDAVASLLDNHDDQPVVEKAFPDGSIEQSALTKSGGADSKEDQSASNGTGTGTSLEKPALSAVTEDAEIWKVLYLIRYPAFAVWFTFTVTLSVFPSITEHIESTEYCEAGSSRFQNQLFIPFAFLLFNLFDFIGRSLPGYAIFTKMSPRMLCYVTTARIVFIPIFLLCNVEDTQLVVAFDDDSAPIIFMILFALTNGWFASLAMVQGPTLVPHESQELAGTAMVFFLTLGLFTGAIMSFFWFFVATGSAT
mmetsp:Transcript_4930/g.19726  ORF Transcript_4930/g.19726 Transcript_4930/m.19726 type:complete len:503 (-) Transcript_4930:146-1654(-)